LEAEERIRWRRRKIKEIKSAFWQEFFEDIVSCFLSTEEPAYDYETLDKLRSGCFPAPYSFQNAEVWNPPMVAQEMQKTGEHPIYSITVDPGQGKATRSVALVWRHDLEDGAKIRHEATLAGFYDPISFGSKVMILGEHYHTAQIVPEYNGHGMAFCAEVKNYKNLYYQQDIISGIATRRVGWKTTGAPRIGGGGTKIYMITELQTILPTVETHDINLINELAQVRYAGDLVKFLSSDDYHDAAAIMAATRPSVRGMGQRGFVGGKGWRRRRR